MRKITLTFPYYNNAGMFQYQWNHIRNYPADIRDNLEVIVIDDGSTDAPIDLPKPSDFSCRIFRTLVDVPWNLPFCRNLGVDKASNEWVLLTDIDHIIPEETIRFLMQSDLDPSRAYTFKRRNATSVNPLESVPHGIHQNTYCLTKALFNFIGGEDERTAGYYSIQEKDFRRRANEHLFELDQYIVQIGKSLIPDASTTNLDRKDPAMRQAGEDLLRERNEKQLPFFKLAYPYTELRGTDGLDMATVHNTAVVTILAYENESLIPSTVNFTLASARRLGIEPLIFLRGQKYVYKITEIDTSFLHKVLRLSDELAKLPDFIKYILYVDARDALFVNPLSVICDEFNRIGWPILISASRKCAHHIDPGWQARFGKHLGGYDFLNAGVWMAKRQAFVNAVPVLKELSVKVKEDRIASSFPPLFENDQHLWQTAYVEHAFPLRLDFEHKIFNNFHQCDIEDYDFSKSTPCNPVVMKNGSTPSIIHFAGQASKGMPLFAWLLNLVPPGVVPPLKL